MSNNSIQVRIPVNTHKKIKSMADASVRSIPKQIQVIVDYFWQHNPEKKKFELKQFEGNENAK